MSLPKGVLVKISEYASCDAVGLADLIARGEVTAAEVADAAARAVEAVNPRINAVVEAWPPEDAPAPGSAPLAGVPFLIKDLGVAMAGKRSELGSRLAAGAVSPEDSFLMRRFRRAGLVTIGRTTTPEMAYSTTTEPEFSGATRNPWSLDRSAGGSSGGSGAAVAAGIVPVAHATDAAGSIRVPASCNGLFGLKPTRGRVSQGPGADEIFNGLAVQGSLSRSVRDSAVLLDLIEGPEPGDPYFAPHPDRPYAEEARLDPGRLRVAVLRQPWGGRQPTEAVSAALSETMRLLESLGHEVEETSLELGVSWEEFVLGNARIWTANLAPWVDGIAAATGRPVDETTLEPVTLASYRYGLQVTADEFVRGLAIRNQVSRTFARHFACYDVLLSPTLPEPPVPLGVYGEGADQLDGLGWLDRVLDRSPYTAAANVSGVPSMSVPLAADAGLPVGMQFTAAFGREDLLFRLAGQLEKAAPWAHRKPPVWAGE
ncbi:amidase [Amycolatopsis echigonensis]|uniref:Amidase n=1 Tax=Amycolatopsis echigonensis TaxID=2576905 RepID=A0A2N3WTF6_9PSEU|nr:amidase [Amycolatopsis niigatensis]PKV97135.1 amidase [Amycolatopsis niigatensis]